MPEDLAHEQVARADGREDDLDDPALLLLDDAGQHREPEAEDADEDQHGADVGEQEAAPGRPRSAGRANRPSVPAGRRAARPGRRRPRPAGPACAGRRPLPSRVWDTTWSGSFGEADRSRPGQVGRHGRPRPRPIRPRARPAAAASSVERTTSTSRSSWPAVAVSADVEPGRCRLDDADHRRLLVPEQERRDDERPDHEQRREQDREHEPATPAALEDLAPGDQPDASPAAHATGSARRRGRAGVGVTASMNSSDSFGGW